MNGTVATFNIGENKESNIQICEKRDYGTISWSCYCAASKAIEKLGEMGKLYIAKGDKESALRVEKEIIQLGKLSELFENFHKKVARDRQRGGIKNKTTKKKSGKSE